jgi:hypothetical protein
MTADLQAIAIEQRWCQSCPSGNLPTAGPVPWLGGPALMRPPGWRELRRKTCVCGNLHGRVLWGMSSRAQRLTCGVLARRSACGTGHASRCRASQSAFGSHASRANRPQ